MKKKIKLAFVFVGVALQIGTLLVLKNIKKR